MADQHGYEDIDEILAEMRTFKFDGDVTYEMRCSYADRLERALRRHDSDHLL